MNIDIDQLAAAVASQLTTAGSFSQTFTCLFNDTPLFTVSDLTTLKVTIFPYRIILAPGKVMPGQQRQRRFRGINEYQYVISLGVQQRGPDATASGIDPIIAFSAGLRLLVQEMIHWLNQGQNRRPFFDPLGASVWLKTIECGELYDMQKLRNERIFQSYTLLTYEEFVRE